MTGWGDLLPPRKSAQGSPSSAVHFSMTTEQAEAIALAEYLRTCDQDEYVEYFEMFGIELGSE